MDEIGVGYKRVSTDLQDTEMQDIVIREQAAKDGVKLIDFYEDDAISGAFIEKRNDLKRLIIDAEKKLFTVVYFYKLDRAFRNLEEQIFVLNKLKKLGIKYNAVRDPEAGGGASGRLMENLLGSINQFERELTAERVFDKHRTMAQKGLWTGGRAPLGYSYSKETKLLSENPLEAVIILKIYDDYEELQSDQQVMELGYINPRSGQPFNITAIRDILTNPHYAGKISWARRRKTPGQKYATRSREYEIFDGIHPALIDWERFQRIQEIREVNSRKKRRPPLNGVYLLTGLLECSHCGKNVVALPRGKGQEKYSPMYRCPTKGRKGSQFCESWYRSTFYIDDTVVEALKTNVRRANMAKIHPSAGTKGQDNYKEKLTQKLQAIDMKLEKQIEAFEAGIIDIVELKKRRTVTMTEKEQIEKDIKKQDKPVATPKEFLEALSKFDLIWDEANAEGRKELVRALIEKIVTDGLTVEIYFKDFQLKGWQRVITTEAQESTKFRRSSV